MTPDSTALEILVARIQKQLAPQAEVLHNVKLEGRQSKIKRQIDVLVRERVGQYEIQIVIDCKDHNKPVDVKGVEEFYGLLRDVGAHKGVLVSPMGFTEAAKTRAAGFQVDLYSPVDTDVHKWQVKVTMPAFCDFRTAYVSFGLSASAPVPFRMWPDFYEKSMIFDAEDKPLGTPLQVAARKWNDGIFPDAPGKHDRLKIFDVEPTRMDNGYDPPLHYRVPADLFVTLYVERELYYGQVPVPQISGFRDEFSGKVITNAFTIGLLDPEQVAREWLKINSEAEAPVQAEISLIGRVLWLLAK
jgi:hypothetical protein